MIQEYYRPTFCFCWPFTKPPIDQLSSSSERRKNLFWVVPFATILRPPLHSRQQLYNNSREAGRRRRGALTAVLCHSNASRVLVIKTNKNKHQKKSMDQKKRRRRPETVAERRKDGRTDSNKFIFFSLAVLLGSVSLYFL